MLIRMCFYYLCVKETDYNYFITAWLHMCNVTKDSLECMQNAYDSLCFPFLLNIIKMT